MNKELTIEDFEVVADDPCAKPTCRLCFFNGNMDGCSIDNSEVGILLETQNGACFNEPEHYYKLKNKE